MKKRLKEEKSTGMRIAELRKNKDITSTKLAELIGVTQGQISNYENDKQIPSAIVLSSIADNLGTTTEYLLKGETNSDTQKSIELINKLDKKNKEKAIDYIQMLYYNQTSKLRAKKIDELLALDK